MQGSISSHNACTAALSSLIVVGKGSISVILAFIHLQTFSIGLRSGDDGALIKSFDFVSCSHLLSKTQMNLGTILHENCLFYPFLKTLQERHSDILKDLLRICFGIDP